MTRGWNLRKRIFGPVIGAISGSPFKPACKALVENACKRYIFSAKDLVNIIHPWLIEKGMAFDQRINIK